MMDFDKNNQTIARHEDDALNRHLDSRDEREEEIFTLYCNLCAEPFETKYQDQECVCKNCRSEIGD